MLWLTDIHVDYKKKEAIDDFFNQVASTKNSKICITGDIAEKESSINFIKDLSKKTKKNIYFVLGNHDFYGSEILSFQNKVFNTFKDDANVHYLPFENAIPISNDTAIVGIDNWYDFSKGDYFTSSVKLRDFKEIKTLTNLNQKDLFTFMQNVSHQLVDQIKKKLTNAFSAFSKVILLVHVPPFRDACLYKNKVADDKWAPFFTHGFLGDFLKEFMLTKKNKFLTVLSGHTHHRAAYSQAFNLNIKVGMCPNEYLTWETICL